MSVRITPCHGCPARAGCPEVDGWRKKIAGLGLRAAKIRCVRLGQELRPGRRIAVTTPRLRSKLSSYSCEPEYYVVHVAVPATITSSRDGEFTCVVDRGCVTGFMPDEEPQDKWRFRRRMKAARIVRFLDEPDRSICDGGRVMSGDSCDRPEGECCQCSETAALLAEWNKAS